MQVAASRDHVGFGTVDWVGEFEAPPGELLEAGRTYDGAPASRSTTPRRGLSITGDCRGCNELSGMFTVRGGRFPADGRARTSR